MGKNIYLTSDQYLSVLDAIEKKLDTNINPHVYDDTTIGNKSTTSSIGLCNDEFTTLETALFPDQFEKHGRRSMKYRLNNQACPFDNRVRNPHKKHGLMDLGCGCYYTCCLRRNIPSNAELKKYVIDTRQKFLSGTLDNINKILTASEV